MGAFAVLLATENMLAGLSLGEHGLVLGGDGCPCLLADQVGQAGDLAQPANPILQIVPKAHSQLATGLLQAGKRVATAATCVVPRPPADLAAFDELADVRLHG